MKTRTGSEDGVGGVEVGRGVGETTGGADPVRGEGEGREIMGHGEEVGVDRETGTYSETSTVCGLKKEIIYGLFCFSPLDIIAVEVEEITINRDNRNTILLIYIKKNQLILLKRIKWLLHPFLEI